MFRYLPVLILLSVMSASAQDNSDTDLLLGISPGMAMRWQQGTMRTTDGFHDCCSFTGGSGIGIAAGLRLWIPLGTALYLRGDVGWERVTSEYSAERKSYPILGQGNTVEYADLRNDLSVSMSAVRIDAGIAYLVLQPGLYVSAGPAVTVPLSPRWTQTERIMGPPGLRYTDGRTSRELIDAEIPGTRPFVSLRFGAGALIPVTEMMRLMPEMQFSIPLMETQPDYRWSMSGLDIALAVMVRI